MWPFCVFDVSALNSTATTSPQYYTVAEVEAINVGTYGFGGTFSQPLLITKTSLYLMLCPHKVSADTV